MTGRVSHFGRCTTEPKSLSLHGVNEPEKIGTKPNRCAYRERDRPRVQIDTDHAGDNNGQSHAISEAHSLPEPTHCTLSINLEKTGNKIPKPSSRTPFGSGTAMVADDCPGPVN